MMGLDMTEPEYRKLWRYFDKDCDGKIEYYEWVNTVGNIILPLPNIHLDRPVSPKEKEYTKRAMARGLKSSIVGLGPDAIDAAFREANSSRSGLLSHQEFVQVRAAACRRARCRPACARACRRSPSPPPLPFCPLPRPLRSCSAAWASTSPTTRRRFTCSPTSRTAPPTPPGR
jgi:hypothetical protein